MWDARIDQATTAAPAQHRTEIPSRRTRTSQTYVTDTGQYEARVYPGSVNYQDASGAWQPIDNTLIPSSRAVYAATNRANRYAVFFPSALGQAPIRIETPDGWIAFSPQGAAGGGTVSGNTDTFSLPGAQLVYAAGNDVLKESILLSGPTSPATHVYTL